MTMEGDPVEQTEGFYARVYALVGQIPPGRVVSYGQLAWALGAPRMARQVGWAMRRCPDALPWQRVVRADGSIAGGGYAALRRALLEGEGIPFTADGRVDMARCAWEIPRRRCTMAEHRDETDFRVWYEEVDCKAEG